MGQQDLWVGVTRLLDRLDEDGIRVHRLGPLAAARWGQLGRRVPADFLYDQRAARAGAVVARAVLARVRAAFGGKVLVLKGPEVAALYPGGARRFMDLDLLVEDAEAAQSALRAAGFEEAPDPSGHWKNTHHLAPVKWPELPLEIEVHDALKWPDGVTAPELDDVFAAAIPSATGLAGVQAPAPHHHALILAAHCWAHTPLRNARDLIDVAATAATADRAAIDATAEAWELRRVWRTTMAAAEWVLGDGARPASVSIWARHLIRGREATVFEGHLVRWTSPFWTLPPLPALQHAAAAFARDFRPSPRQTWRQKAGSLGRAVRHAFQTKSAHGWINEDVPPPADDAHALSD